MLGGQRNRLLQHRPLPLQIPLGPQHERQLQARLGSQREQPRRLARQAQRLRQASQVDQLRDDRRPGPGQVRARGPRLPQERQQLLGRLVGAGQLAVAIERASQDDLPPQLPADERQVPAPLVARLTQLHQRAHGGQVLDVALEGRAERLARLLGPALPPPHEPQRRVVAGAVGVQPLRLLQGPLRLGEPVPPRQAQGQLPVPPGVVRIGLEVVPHRRQPRLPFVVRPLHQQPGEAGVVGEGRSRRGHLALGGRPILERGREPQQLGQGLGRQRLDGEDPPLALPGRRQVARQHVRQRGRPQPGDLLDPGAGGVQQRLGPVRPPEAREQLGHLNLQLAVGGPLRERQLEHLEPLGRAPQRVQAVVQGQGGLGEAAAPPAHPGPQKVERLLGPPHLAGGGKIQEGRRPVAVLQAGGEAKQGAGLVQAPVLAQEPAQRIVGRGIGGAGADGPAEQRQGPPGVLGVAQQVLGQQAAQYGIAAGGADERLEPGAPLARSLQPPQAGQHRELQRGHLGVPREPGLQHGQQPDRVGVVVGQRGGGAGGHVVPGRPVLQAVQHLPGRRAIVVPQGQLDGVGLVVEALVGERRDWLLRPRGNQQHAPRSRPGLLLQQLVGVVFDDVGHRGIAHQERAPAGIVADDGLQMGGGRRLGGQREGPAPIDERHRALPGDGELARHEALGLGPPALAGRGGPVEAESPRRWTAPPQGPGETGRSRPGWPGRRSGGAGGRRAPAARPGRRGAPPPDGPPAGPAPDDPSNGPSGWPRPPRPPGRRATPRRRRGAGRSARPGRASSPLPPDSSSRRRRIAKPSSG